MHMIFQDNKPPRTDVPKLPRRMLLTLSLEDYPNDKRKVRQALVQSSIFLVFSTSKILSQVFLNLKNLMVFFGSVGKIILILIIRFFGRLE